MVGERRAGTHCDWVTGQRGPLSPAGEGVLLFVWGLWLGDWARSQDSAAVPQREWGEREGGSKRMWKDGRGRGVSPPSLSELEGLVVLILCVEYVCVCQGACTLTLHSGLAFLAVVCEWKQVEVALHWSQLLPKDLNKYLSFALVLISFS